MQSHPRAVKRAKTTTSTQLAMALYQGKAGSSLLEAMTEAVVQGMYVQLQWCHSTSPRLLRHD
jgi:hypothetical protein